MIKTITSADNKFIKIAAKLKNKGERNKTGLFTAEGKRICADAVRSGCVEYLICCGEMPDCTDIDIYSVDERLYAKVSDTKSPQGITAVCRLPACRLCYDGDIVVCDGISDPGNLGTIIRTAECAGFCGVVLINSCADPFNPKTVRATMGSIFRIPIVPLTADGLFALSEYTVAATSLEASVDIFKAEFGEKTALVIGSEARGVSDAVVKNAALRVKIPMSGGAESINAAVAAGIAMYAVKNYKG